MRIDSAGVRVVRNQGPDRQLDWTAHEVLRLGGEEEGPEAFFRVNANGIAVDKAGRLYVLESGDREVHVFDRNGAHVRTMGGEGGGPGEFKAPGALFVTAEGHVLVLDLGKRAYVRFAEDGTALSEVRLPGGVQIPTAQPVSAGGGLVAAIDTVLNATGDIQPGTPLRQRLVLFRRVVSGVWADSVKIGTIDWAQPTSFVPLGPPDCPMKIATPPVFTRTPVWRVSGNNVFFNGTEEYIVEMTSLAGERVSIRRTLPVAVATREIAATEIGSAAFEIGGIQCGGTAYERADQVQWMDRVPWIRDVAQIPDGTLLIERRAPGEAIPSRIDVFDEEGVYTGTLPPDFPFSAIWRSRDEFLSVEYDAVGLAYVVVYRVEEEGNGGD